MRQVDRSALNRWRGWAQFVWKDGGPVSGTDQELQAAVCQHFDKIAKEYVAELHTIRQQTHTLMRDEIDATWAAIENGFDIEPRAYFEKEAPRNGFRFALVQAIHHLWKRDAKVQQLDASLTALRAYVQHREDCELTDHLPPMGIPFPQTDADKTADVWRWPVAGGRTRVIRTHTCGMQDQQAAPFQRRPQRSQEDIDTCPGCNENFQEYARTCTCGLRDLLP